MKYKYLILDFGNVLVTPPTGNWDITPKFLEQLDTSKIDMDLFKQIRTKNKDILSTKLDTLESEYEMFYTFYNNILTELNYPNYNEDIAKKIAYDRTYNNHKYNICPNIYKELEHLKSKYTLILLTDNWPDAIPYLKENNLLDYFTKIYISSFYGVEKKDKVFFDYPIKEFNIKKGEALFIDDVEKNLDIAYSKGLDVLHMDRLHNLSKSKYKIIDNLFLNDNKLLLNIDKVHTTKLGMERIKKNINKDINYIIEKIQDNNCKITKEGKNYYCEIDNIRITINSNNYCIITAHKVQK